MIPGSVLQAAAIPLRDRQVCLVTSSDGRRWVVPKGKIDPGYTPEQAALTETWEEAGLMGKLGAAPVGEYQYEKYGRVHHVTVFIMTVSEERADWPEKRTRRREWVPLPVAIERVQEPGLKAILQQVLGSEALPGSSPP